MKIVEFRIPLPVSMSELHRCLLYLVTKASMQEMESGSGIEIFKNEAYERDGIIGRHTEKRFHLAKNLPSWLQSILGQDLTVLSELSWNTFPYTLTKYSNKKLTTFEFSFESLHCEGLDYVDNALNLSASDLSQRKVIIIDLTAFKMSKVYDPSIDVTLCKTEHTSTLPLHPNWMNDAGGKGVISYKILKVDFPYFGFLASKIENYVVSFLQDKIMVYMSTALCCMDEWYNADIGKLRIKESECYMLLNQKFREQYGHLVSVSEPHLRSGRACEDHVEEPMNTDPIFIPPIERVVEDVDDSDEFCDCLEEFEDNTEFNFHADFAYPSYLSAPLRLDTSDEYSYDNTSHTVASDVNVKSLRTYQGYATPGESSVSCSLEELDGEGPPITTTSLPIATSPLSKDDGKYTPSVFTGYLYKLGGTFFYQWNIRYIVISSGKLYYFDSRENTRPRAAINLADARINWVGEYMNRSYVFSVTTKSKRISYWSADRKPSVKRWILLLQVLCESSPDTLIEDLAAGYLYRLSGPDSAIDDNPPTATNVIHGL